MTTKEFAVIAAAIKTYFPRDSVLPTEKAMELWYNELKDLSYNAVNLGLRMYVATNKFAPMIADIREYAGQFYAESDEELNEMAAWGLVLKAMRNSIYHSEEEFAKLPPVVQKAVVSPGQLREWAMAEDVDGTWMNVTQSNFMRTYRAELYHEKTLEKLPPDILKLVGKSTGQIPVIQTSQKMLSVSEERKIAERDASPVPERLKERFARLMGRAG
ncbi:MAG: hypothetical protein K1W38_17130 [Lachnospiraceae bacterium]|jgi:hypothetical protein